MILKHKIEKINHIYNFLIDEKKLYLSKNINIIYKHVYINNKFIYFIPSIIYFR